MDNANDNINILDKNVNDEYIMFQHNFMKNDLIRGLQIVEDYIIDNDLMLVGGMAIDLALRVKNDKLYDDIYNIADYDIISPENVIHANKIGSILCDNQFKNISIIPAIHKTTVRVQMSGYTLFDATFVPSYIYNKIPHMQYKNINFIDPIFQKIDQFISLSFLFDLTGAQYNIQHRMTKDDERKKLLNEYYNLKYDNSSIKLKNNLLSLDLNIFNNTNINKILIKDLDNVLCDKSDIETVDLYNNIKKNDIDMNNSYYSINCDITYHGAIAYNLIYYMYINMIKTLESNNVLDNSDNDYINDTNTKINMKPDVKIDNNISFNHYAEIPIILINNNDNIDLIIENIKKTNNISDIKKLENIAHKIPNRVSSNIQIDDLNYNLQIYDLYGKLLSTNIIEINSKLFHIANYNYILSYFLFYYYYSDDNDIKNLYKSYYLSLINIIKCSKYLFNKYTTDMNKYNINTSWFRYSINTLGFENCSENYYYFVKNFNYLVLNNKNLTELPPKNYIGYPNCAITKTFDDSKSPYYNKFENEIIDTNFSQDLKIQLDQFK